MTKIEIIAPGSEMYQFLLELEALMEKNDIRITGAHMVIETDGKEFKIGRDQDCFPRSIEENFWRYK